MLAAVAILTVMAIVALFAAIIVGNAIIAWVCVGICVAGLLLLFVDARRQRAGSELSERRSGGYSHLFGDKETSRDLIRERHTVSQDMMGFVVPFEEGNRF
jgi:hypothetical protein